MARRGWRQWLKAYKLKSSYSNRDKDKSVVNDLAIERLKTVKQIRNEIVQDGHSKFDFTEFFGLLVATVAHLYFAIDSKNPSLRIFPYGDFRR